MQDGTTPNDIITFPVITIAVIFTDARVRWLQEAAVWTAIQLPLTDRADLCAEKILLRMIPKR
jgi:hypothetical protein